MNYSAKNCSLNLHLLLETIFNISKLMPKQAVAQLSIMNFIAASIDGYIKRLFIQ